MLGVILALQLGLGVLPAAAQEETHLKPELGQVCSAEARERLDNRLRIGVEEGGLPPSEREAMMERWEENCAKLGEVAEEPHSIDPDMEERVTGMVDQHRREANRFWEERQNVIEASGIPPARIHILVARLAERLLGGAVSAEDILAKLKRRDTNPGPVGRGELPKPQPVRAY